jgi:pimeloyl-ACP methyl ester carboxylesterase
MAVAFMILAAAAGAGGVWALRRLAHGAILRALRAPRLAHIQGPDALGIAADRVREVRIPGPRGRQLFGWLVSPSVAAERPVPAVLVMHGWGANASMMWPVVPPLHAVGFAVLLVDARCHGRSDDETFTSMPRFAEDIAAGLTWLRLQPEVASDRLALLGHSVGAAAALLHASRHHDVRAVVSLSAFAHPREVMRRFMAGKHVPYPVLGWYVLRHVQRVIGVSFDDIAPLATLTRVRCPTLLVHGRKDGTVPVNDAQRLLAVSDRARLLLVDGDHDLREALAPHSQTLVDFLRGACATRAAVMPGGVA